MFFKQYVQKDDITNLVQCLNVMLIPEANERVDDMAIVTIHARRLFFMTQ